MRLCPEGRFLPVLVPAVPPDEDEIDETGAPAADNGDFGGNIAGCVFGAEGLGT